MFDMGRTLDPADGAAALQIGTPTILGLAALDGALDATEAAGIAAIRDKSLRLTAYLMAQLEARLPSRPMPSASPTRARTTGAADTLRWPTRKARASAVRSRRQASSRISAAGHRAPRAGAAL